MRDLTPNRSLPGTVLGRGLLIVFAVVTIPAYIGIYLAADVLAPQETSARNNRVVSAPSRDEVASGVTAVRIDAAIGIATGIVLLTLAFAIGSYPLPALLAAGGIYLGRFASLVPVLPWMPWRWPWLVGLTLVGVGLSGCVIRASLARRKEIIAAADAPSEIPARAYIAYYVAYVLVLFTPVVSLAAITASSPGLREPLEFLLVSAFNTAIIAVIVLCTMVAARLPRLRPPEQADRRAWTLAPLAVCLLVGVAWAYHRGLASLLPSLTDDTAMRAHAHLLPGWIIVGCALPALLEEWLFRRLALATLGSLMSIPLAVVVSAIIFASAHAVSPLNMPIQFVLGIILGWSHIATGRLVLPVLLHFLFNFALLTLAVA